MLCLTDVYLSDITDALKKKKKFTLECESSEDLLFLKWH